LVLDDNCVDSAVRGGRTLIGALVECGAGKQTVDYATWLLTTISSGSRTFCIEASIKQGYTWTKALLRCGFTLHEVIVLRAVERFENRGYTVLWRYEDLPEEIKRYGEPDLVAVKDGEMIIFEAKDDDQLRRYSQAAREVGGRIILALSMLSGENVEVWGLKELGIEEQ
jgi:hypothetical protein